MLIFRPHQIHVKKGLQIKKKKTSLDTLTVILILVVNFPVNEKNWANDVALGTGSSYSLIEFLVANYQK